MASLRVRLDAAALRVRAKSPPIVLTSALDPDAQRAIASAIVGVVALPKPYGPALRDAVLSATAPTRRAEVPMTSRQILDGSTRAQWYVVSARCSLSPCAPVAPEVDRDGRAQPARAGRDPSPARCRARPGEGALGARADRDGRAPARAVQIADDRPPAPSKVPAPIQREGERGSARVGAVAFVLAVGLCLAGLGATLAGCPKVIREPALPPPPDGCDAGATLCHQGAPWRCGPGGHWSQADRRCDRLGAADASVVCCRRPPRCAPARSSTPASLPPRAPEVSR